jgi:4-aminobutyrate aminotransferase-like enzyme
MAAAMATIEVIEDNDLKANARVVGAHLRQRLDALKEKHQAVGDVRGMGLMQAVELVKDRKSKAPDVQTTNRLMEETKKRGVLVGKGGLYGNVIRTGVMLNSTRAHVDEMCDAVDEGLSAAASAA